MKDLISRQAAIEAIKEDKIDLTNPNVVAVFKATGDFEKVETQVMTCDRHIEILKDLPSAQPEQRWIPCSDRLPEYGEAVLTVNEDGDYEVNHIIDEDNGEWFYEGAIAWMALPPYKEG